MPRISVLEIFKIGVGPSSSHTLGPWRAAESFLAHLSDQEVERIDIHLYGSLAKTGRGHGTDIAILLGLAGWDPVTCDPAQVIPFSDQIRREGALDIRGQRTPFTIHFEYEITHPTHPNAVTFKAGDHEKTYFSVGGGFIVEEGADEMAAQSEIKIPFPIETAADLERYCDENQLDIAQIVLANEDAWRSWEKTQAQLRLLWTTMLECIWRGCHTDGILPGGLLVRRRAKTIHDNLVGESSASDPQAWLEQLQSRPLQFDDTLRWVTCFALAVNEENAAFGRVVTAPTNGAAGVIPAVLAYAVLTLKLTQNQIEDFLLVAGEIGSIFKKGATISAAMGGCQAEIGVSSAMAAAALCHIRGGSPARCLMAAEIAMEHHLGMTCDPIGGLVQIPCIERNTMGAMKAITAASIALDSDPAHARVSLDDVIRTMWETAQDMNSKYKETAEGGLATQVSVAVPEC